MPRKPDYPNNVIQLNVFDPENINQRLYHQVSMLLKQLEEKDSHSKVTMRERIAALVAVGRIQDLFIKMRKSTGDVGSGATVRKYASTFSDAASRRKSNPRSTGKSEPEPDDWFESADRDIQLDPDDGPDAA